MSRMNSSSSFSSRSWLLLCSSWQLKKTLLVLGHFSSSEVTKVDLRYTPVSYCLLPSLYWFKFPELPESLTQRCS